MSSNPKNVIITKNLLLGNTCFNCVNKIPLNVSEKVLCLKDRSPHDIHNTCELWENKFNVANIFESFKNINILSD